MFKKIQRQWINIQSIHAVTLPAFLWHFFKFLFFYTFSRGKAPFPLNITLELTNQCNLNCSYCYLQSNEKNPLKNIPQQYLSYQELRDLINSVKNKHTTFFLTGGEPSLCPDLERIIDLIKKNHFHCGMVTNGLTLADSFIQTIHSSRLDYLFFSIDGDQLIHEKIRGENTFKKIYENIKTIIESRKEKCPKIIFNVTVLKDNYTHLRKVIDIAADLGIDCVSVNFLTFLTRDEYSKHLQHFSVDFPYEKFASHVYVNNFDDGVFQNIAEEFNALKAYAKKRKIQSFFKPNLNLSEMSRWHDQDFYLKRKCVYPWNVVRIAPNGDVYPCAQFMIPIGNIKEQNLQSIWNSPKFQDFRQKLKGQGLMPGCNRCCKL
jgi:MoaA/NifB/PqqE/SkfB family radical SAM enzyme